MEDRERKIEWMRCEGRHNARERGVKDRRDIQGPSRHDRQLQ